MAQEISTLLLVGCPRLRRQSSQEPAVALSFLWAENVKSPAFQFYPGDWLSSSRITQMTPEQEGAYIRLLCYDWSDDGIPNDDEVLAKLSRMGQGWLQNGGALVKQCFQPHPTKKDFLTNPRLQIEREKQLNWRKKSSEGGKKSAVKRWGKADTKENKGGYQMVTECLIPKCNSSSSSSPSSTSTPIVPIKESQTTLPVNGEKGEIGVTRGYHKDARVILHVLNQTTGKAFRETDFNLKIISQRLEEPGVTVDGIRKMISRQCEKWKGTEMAEYLRPETLFRRGKFDGYYAAKDTAAKPSIRPF